ncbi:MAG TPA: hypothetical protein VG841_06055 [Caulobacterales bacterium]|nr:hypothetical protein [Caulobacterales bacterium]
MIAPEDPFALHFDAITPDPALAARTLDDPMLRIPLESEAHGLSAPGFFLLNDANGRFVVDREMGVISVASAEVLETERDSIHVVRLKVVEASGSEYELDLRLKLNGYVPQIAEAGEFGELPPLAPIADAEPAPVPCAPFTRFRAFELGRVGPLGPEDAAFGALIEPPALSSAASHAALALDAAIPASAARHARWLP